MSEEYLIYHSGWRPPPPDPRDYNERNVVDHPTLMNIREADELPHDYFIDEYCSPVEDQKNLGSCTAFAREAVKEACENIAFGACTKGSKRFAYKTTRQCLNLQGDVGAYNRGAMGALVSIGSCPHKFWRYNVDNFDKTPGGFQYSLAKNYVCTQYFRHDTTDMPQECVITSIKKYLYGKIPSVLGFYVYESFDDGSSVGHVPFPDPNEQLLGGHAVMICGYSDSVVIKNNRNGKQTVGALMFKNSWGKEWGIKGYGWLPYEYVNKRLSNDIWSAISIKWLDTGKFGF